mgnify:CR=1 FL=1
MTPRDLRVGNMISYNGEPVMVEGIEKTHITITNNKRVDVTDSGLGYIPINENIIKTLKFYKYSHKNGSTFWIDNTSSVCYNTDRSSLWSFNEVDGSVSFISNCRFFHHLQNLYYFIVNNEINIFE